MPASVRYTNLEVLATVVERRSWRRYVPPALFALALCALFLSLGGRRQLAVVASERATVILVLDTSRSMQAKDVSRRGSPRRRRR